MLQKLLGWGRGRGQELVSIQLRLLVLLRVLLQLQSSRPSPRLLPHDAPTSDAGTPDISGARRDEDESCCSRRNCSRTSRADERCRIRP